jgi:putative transposase
VLGEVVDDNRVVLSLTGSIVRDAWSSLSEFDRSVALDEFVIMPNHIHGILMLIERSAALPAIIGSFKSRSTRTSNAASNRAGDRLWQRSYHENVIRDERALERIREYIVSNPAKWHVDLENPANFARVAPRAGQARPLQIRSDQPRG